MILEDGRITILANQEGVEITITDSDSNTDFCKVLLTSEQFTSALSRLMHVRCTVQADHLDRVGKKMEHRVLEAMLRPDIADRKEAALLALKDAMPESWTYLSTYLGSKGSFFTKDGQDWARTTIRRWV